MKVRGPRPLLDAKYRNWKSPVWLSNIMGGVVIIISNQITSWGPHHLKHMCLSQLHLCVHSSIIMHATFTQFTIPIPTLTLTIPDFHSSFIVAAKSRLVDIDPKYAPCSHQKVALAHMRRGSSLMLASSWCQGLYLYPVISMPCKTFTTKMQCVLHHLWYLVSLTNWDYTMLYLPVRDCFSSPTKVEQIVWTL